MADVIELARDDEPGARSVRCAWTRWSRGRRPGARRWTRDGDSAPTWSRDARGRRARAPGPRGQQPARQRREVEPRRPGPVEVAVAHGEVSRARPRPGHPRGRPAPRLRPLLPRADARGRPGSGPGTGDRAPGDRAARRLGVGGQRPAAGDAAAQPPTGPSRRAGDHPTPPLAESDPPRAKPGGRSGIGAAAARRGSRTPARPPPAPAPAAWARRTAPPTRPRSPPPECPPAAPYASGSRRNARGR